MRDTNWHFILELDLKARIVLYILSGRKDPVFEISKKDDHHDGRDDHEGFVKGKHLAISEPIREIHTTLRSSKKKNT